MARPIELLLLDNVDNLGIVGDVVKVKAGYARNFLLPRALATKPTAEKVAELADRRAQVEAEMKALAASQKAMIEKLEGHELHLERAANDQGVLFGGVSQHDIAQALRDEGFALEDRFVRLGDQIKRLDTYLVPIVVNRDLKTEIKVWVVSDRPLEDEDASADQATAEPAEPAEASA